MIKGSLKTFRGRATLVAVLWMLFVVNLKFPLLAFSYESMGNTVFCIFMVALLPLIMVDSLVFSRKFVLVKIIFLVVFALLLLIFIFLSLTDFEYRMNPPSGGIVYARMEYEGGRISAYKDGEGAFGKSWVIVRQERSLIFGIYLIRDIYKKYYASSLQMHINSNEINIDGEIFPLRKYVYF